LETSTKTYPFCIPSNSHLSFFPIAPPLSRNNLVLNTLLRHKLLQLLNGIIRVRNTVSNRSRIRVDLVVVAALVCLVAEEVDLGVLDAAGLLGVFFEEPQTVRLVPAGGEDVEGDLSADGVAMGG
jgi:hypothetical protein